MRFPIPRAVNQRLFLFQTHLESVEKVLATFRSVELKRRFLNEHSSLPHG